MEATEHSEQAQPLDLAVDRGVRAPVPKLDEVASRIRAHLKQLENDEAWNVTKDGRRRMWQAYATRAGSRVACTYVSYQGTTNLTRDEAMRYLAALDGGFKGRHFEAFREQKAP